MNTVYATFKAFGCTFLYGEHLLMMPDERRLGTFKLAGMRENAYRKTMAFRNAPA